MPKRLITYRGHEMSPDWPQKIHAAQWRTHLTKDGVTYPRIPYGQEATWAAIAMEPPATCGDCGVMHGELHVEYCDVEACPACLTGQWLCCQDAPCHDPFAEELSAIEELPETRADVYAPTIVIPDNQLPLL